MIERLTEREKDALRLYYHLNSAKRVGQQLGISHHTVYDRFASAKQKLEVDDVMIAARLLVQAERTGTPDGVGYDGFGVAGHTVSAAISPSRLPWPFPTKGRPINDLSFAERLFAVVGIAIFFMLVVAAYFTALHYFSSLVS